MAREKLGDTNADNQDEADRSDESLDDQSTPAADPSATEEPEAVEKPEAAEQPEAAEKPEAVEEADAVAESDAATEEPEAKQERGESSPAGKGRPEAGTAATDRRPGGKKKASSSRPRKKAAPANLSATARQANEARATMQRQHRRIELARAAAIGAEAAGVAGLIVAGVLAWEWTDRLWGNTDGVAVAAQALIGLTAVATVVAWVLRSARGRAAARVLAITAALAVGGLGASLAWNADPGGRGPGGLVAAVAALLVVIGAVGWLIGLRQLNALFAFGVRYAKSGGYGNLTAVRRARMLGTPLGAVLGGAAVAAAVVLVPGWVSTVDTQTSDPVIFSGDSPGIGTAPSWEVSVEAGANATTRSTPGGLAVDETSGVRMLDPSTGDTRWHWRDSAYLRATTSLADEGRLMVLGLRYEGDQDGRDRLVALDSTTGEVLWDRFDDGLVDTMALLAVASKEGTWLATPGHREASPEAEVDPNASDNAFGLRLLDLTTGETVWEDEGAPECQMSAIGGGSADVVTVVENCPAPPDAETEHGQCLISGFSAEDGSRLWNWPAGDRIDQESEYANSCRLTALGDLAYLTYQVTGFEFDPGAPVTQTPALALDPHTGQEVWAVERDEDSYAPLGVDGLTNPATVTGGRIVGVEWTSGQPGVGAAALIIRDLADGSRVGEVALPEGQPVGVRESDDDTVLISHYAPETDEVMVLEVDLAAQEVVAEAVVARGTPDQQFRSAGLAVGPGTVAVDTLVVPGPDAGPEDLRLIVHGYA